jgi:hypothetical protein
VRDEASGGQRDAHEEDAAAAALLASELELAEVALGAVLVHAQLGVAGEAAVRQGAHLEDGGARDLDRARRISTRLEASESLAGVDELLDVPVELTPLGPRALAGCH